MKTNILVILGIFFLMTNCKNDPPFVEKSYRIKIQNNSNTLVYYMVSFAYPDTVIPNESNNMSGVKAMDYSYKSSTHDWDEVFSENSASKMSFFFFSPDTITKYGWDTVRSGYKILKRKDFSMQELKNSNYNVTYP